MPILNGTKLLARARRYADDVAEPYYISDTEMYTWLTEAESALARAGMLIRDVVTYTVNSTTSSRWVRIRSTPEIIEVRKAVLIDSNGNRYPLKLEGVLSTDPMTSEDEDYGVIAPVASLTPGRPLIMGFGRRTNYFELRPVSDGAYTIEAYVVTYPTYPIERAGDEPTIAERYHPDIAIGAALMALEGTDDEQLVDRARGLERAWAAALKRAEGESTSLDRDSTEVRFSNDMWV